MKINFSQSLQISLVLSWKAIILTAKIFLGILSLAVCLFLFAFYLGIDWKNYSLPFFSVPAFFIGLYILITFLFRKHFNEVLNGEYKRFRLIFVDNGPSLSFYLKWTFWCWLFHSMACSFLSYGLFGTPVSQYLLSEIGLADVTTPTYFMFVEFLLIIFTYTFIVMYLVNEEIKVSKLELRLVP